MLGDISPQTVRITQQAVVYPGRDHVTSLRVERFDGRTYKPVDMTAVTRVILSFPEADPVIVYDSSVQAVFTHVGTTLTVDLSDYAMPASVLGCQIILYDAEHPAGQVLVDDIDAVVQFDFRNVSPVGGIPAPAVDYLTDAPIDGVTYARKGGLWVPVDAMVSGVSSVNGQSGVVVLDAADVGADAAGTATTAAAAAVSAHAALADPHPQYLTPVEGNAAYERVLTAGTNVTIDRTNPSAPVINVSGGGGGGAVDSVNGQTGVVVLDAADVGADVAGAATAAVAAHTAASDPHPQYLTPAEASSAYAPLAHVGSGGAAHANAIAAGAAGFMTGADKTKLDGVAAGATQNSADATLLARANHTGTQTASTISDFASAARAQTEAELVAGANITITPSGSGATRQLTVAATGGGGGGSTNLSTTTSTTTLTVNSDTGTDAVLPAATPSVAGVLTAADKTKLDGIATGATANSADAALLARANHTGTQTASTISDFTGVTQDVVGVSVVAGANVTVTYDDGTGLTTVAATGGGGLTNFTEAKTTASPNATIPVVSLMATSAEANVDLAITPKGSGALLLQVPNDSTSGGAKRGLGAIDMQRYRGGAGQVASGTRSVLIGGANSTASGTDAVVIGAYLSTASGTNAAIMGGSTNAATANNAVVAGGSSNTANGDSSSIVGGSSATTRTISGAEARASGAFGAQGDAQRQRHILRRATSGATASVLTTDGNSSAAATNQVVLPNQGAYHFTGKLVARSSAGDCAAFEFKGAIKRGANAAATSLVSAVTPVVVAADSGASAWALAVSVNTTLGCLSLTVTGAAATTIRWVADVETVEVVG